MASLVRCVDLQDGALPLYQGKIREVLSWRQASMRFLFIDPNSAADQYCAASSFLLNLVSIATCKMVGLGMCGDCQPAVLANCSKLQFC